MTTSYANWGGQGNRTGLIAATFSGITGGGGSNYAIPLIDGDHTSGSTVTSAAWGGSNTAAELKFDFRAGNAVVIDEFTWYQSDSSTHGTWDFEGSNDDSTYTGLAVGITLGGATNQDYPFSNATPYRYYRLIQTGGTTNASPWLEEIEFKIGHSELGYDDTYGRGDRHSIITSSDSGITGGCGSNYAAPMVDGSFVNGCSTAAAWGGSNTAGLLKWDFGSGNDKVLTEFLWYQDINASHGTWSFAGSNDDVTYDDLLTGIALGVSSGYGQAAFPFANTTSYQYWKLYQTAGTTSGSSWNREIEFKIGQGGGISGEVWNQADHNGGGALVFSNTDHTVTTTSGGNFGVRGTIPHSTGQWYIEYSNILNGGGGGRVGFAAIGDTLGGNGQFGIDPGGGTHDPSAGSYNDFSSTAPDGHVVDFAIDFDNGWFWARYDGGDWNGDPSADLTTGAGSHSLAGIAGPVFPYVWLQNNPGTCDINGGDSAFTHAAPSGFTPWMGTGGSAGDGDAAGDTVTATTSIIPGGPTVRAIDGSAILEATFRSVPGTTYFEADYDSIWSRGDRVHNGLIAPGLRWSSVGSEEQLFDNNFGFGAGNGLTLGASGSELAGNMFFWDTGKYGLELHGFKLFRQAGGTVDGTWALYGGLSPDFLWVEPYTPTDSFSITFSDTDPETGYPVFEMDFSPRHILSWPTYAIQFVATMAFSGTGFNEMYLKVAHSILDGGDRRSTNGRPEKQVAFSMSADWAYVNTGGPINPADALFDGVYARGNSGDSQKAAHQAIIKKSTGSGDSSRQDIVGAWLQFVFPRAVMFRHLLLSVSTQVEEYDSGDLPMHYGTWHWEISDNGGSTWRTVGDPWSFTDAGGEMLAPRTGDFGMTVDMYGEDPSLTSPDFSTHWRMVLDAGPAFRENFALNQFVFDLTDPGGLGTNYSVAFTDDADGTAIPFTLGPPGSPYTVKLTDGTSDALAFTVSNTPNPVLTVAFDDGASFDTWSDLYPSLVVQTIVNATGR